MERSNQLGVFVQKKPLASVKELRRVKTEMKALSRRPLIEKKLYRCGWKSAKSKEDYAKSVDFDVCIRWRLALDSTWSKHNILTKVYTFRCCGDDNTHTHLLTSARNSVGAEMLSSASVYSLRSSLLLDVGFSKPTFPLSSVVMMVEVLE